MYNVSTVYVSQEACSEWDKRVGGGGVCACVRAVFVRPLTMRPREDRASFLSERFPMTNRSFVHRQIEDKKKMFLLILSWRSLFEANFNLSTPSPSRNPTIERSLIVTANSPRFTHLHSLSLSLLSTGGILPPCEFGPHKHYRSHTVKHCITVFVSLELLPTILEVNIPRPKYDLHPCTFV